MDTIWFPEEHQSAPSESTIDAYFSTIYRRPGRDGKVDNGNKSERPAPPVGYADPTLVREDLGRVLVISDTHWFHQNVVAYTGRPADHDALMIRRWLQTVGPDDVVLHCGDVAVGVNVERLARELPVLPGRIHLIRGNHDYGKRLRHYVSLGWTLLKPFDAEYLGWTIHFSHKPVYDLPDHVINVHGHIHQHSAPSPRHINVSVEQLGYGPVRLEDLLHEAIGRLGSARKPLLKAASTRPNLYVVPQALTATAPPPEDEV